MFSQEASMDKGAASRVEPPTWGERITLGSSWMGKREGAPSVDPPWGRYTRYRWPRPSAPVP
jgi:hypothetical protein